jgi:hypothetical protein
MERGDEMVLGSGIASVPSIVLPFLLRSLPQNPFGKKRDVSGILVDTLPRDYPAPGTNT